MTPLAASLMNGITESSKILMKTGSMPVVYMSYVRSEINFSNLGGVFTNLKYLWFVSLYSFRLDNMFFERKTKKETKTKTKTKKEKKKKKEKRMDNELF